MTKHDDLDDRYGEFLRLGVCPARRPAELIRQPILDRRYCRAVSRTEPCDGSLPPLLLNVIGKRRFDSFTGQSQKTGWWRGKVRLFFQMEL
jgi:hypothetical protein